MTPPDLSVVVPVYNGAATLEKLYRELCAALRTLNFELIFVDDASTDQSLALLREMAKRDVRVTVLALRQNQGQQEATLCGMLVAKGRYLANLDDDGQHPPEYLPPMLHLLQEKNLDIVYGLPVSQGRRLVRQGGSVLRDLLFYLFFPYSRGVKVSSFRVMRAELVQRIVPERPEFFYFSASVFRHPVRAANLPYPHQRRSGGKSGYRLSRLAALYLNIIRYYVLGRGKTRREAPAPAGELIHYG
ncbi:MAG TPA: glycosyltransferase [Clostridiales bacterium]|nr:glycosyltransferase [Clostridiales bacterium]